MKSTSVQEMLFQHIKGLIPPDQSLVEVVAELLNLSQDSAYRRIRDETPLLLNDASLLCDHFNMSLDNLMEIKSNSILFKEFHIESGSYSYKNYLNDLIGQLKYLDQFREKEILYITKDIPLFQSFYFKPLRAFRYFFWMKSVVQDPDFIDRQFVLDCLPDEIDKMCLELCQLYNLVDSTEIWNTESVNSVIFQIDFYADSGYFNQSADIKTVYESLMETIKHIQSQVVIGSKYLPGENGGLKKQNYQFYYNRVVLGDNTVMTLTDQLKTIFINYNILHYIMTRDVFFCEKNYQEIQNLIKRSTPLSNVSERHRNRFFNILLSKVEDKLKNL
jgi:hypothetical protein